jgi:hypothetical protein
MYPIQWSVCLLPREWCVVYTHNSAWTCVGQLCLPHCCTAGNLTAREDKALQRETFRRRNKTAEFTIRCTLPAVNTCIISGNSNTKIWFHSAPCEKLATNYAGICTREFLIISDIIDFNFLRSDSLIMAADLLMRGIVTVAVFLCTRLGIALIKRRKVLQRNWFADSSCLIKSFNTLIPVLC